MEDSHTSEIADCLRSLCGRLAVDKENAYRFAVSYLAEDTMRFPLHDEQLLAQRIQAKLLKTKTSREANLFAECHQKLKSSILFKDRVSLLAFFYALAPSQRDAENEKRNTAARDLTLAQMSLHSPSSFDDILPSTISSETQSVQPSHILYPQPVSGSMFGSSSQPDSMNKLSMLSRFSSHVPTASSISAKQRSSLHTYKSTSFDSVRKQPSIYDGDLSEQELLQDVVFTIQGVRGRLNMASGALLRPRAALLLRLGELGFLHDRLKEFTDAASGYMPHGLVGEGLVSALRNELTEYYRSIAILQSQLTDDGQNTLRRLVVWSVEPLHRLKWLTTVAHAAHTKKGGELASCVHRFASHGDPRVHNLAKHLLAAVCYPLYIMLSRWLLDGEIEDPFNEFFIESRSGVSIDRMWHDKYRVREPMLPSFITRQQAQQILATGKSVVFMREACGDTPDLGSGERDALKRVLDSNSVELLFSSSPETRLHAVMADAYYDTSRRLLHTLLTQHRLRDHLAAHRRYLLLAQGDFVHHLMRLIEPELNKSASQLHVHNLTCTLEAAVRATNAQYEQPDVIGRLYVNMFPSQPYDSGWDVFSLQYRVDGPLGTLFPATTAARYRALFTHLWRTTRMEHTLHALWRTHTLQHKTLKDMPEVQSLLRRVSMLRAEAIRFCGELQHHCACGALEASWGTLQASIASADCLDDVLAAHELFLTEVAVGAMLDDSTKGLQSYLGNVFEEMLILRTFEESLYARIGEERERRNHIENLKDERINRGEFAITLAEEADHKEKIKIFQQYLVSRKADLNVLARSYRGHVKTFILKLALHNEVSLQTLAFRLDYNDFYKKGDSKLHEPLTYQHKRLSEVGISLVKSSSSNLNQRKRERIAERSTKRK